MKQLPLALTLLRAALAPVVILLALMAPNPQALGGAFGLCLVLAFLSDLFDGIIARRLGVATPQLRRMDSAADSLFYVAATFAVWHLHPEAITRRWLPLALLVALEITRYVYDYAKFRREASYHMWSSKCWGLALFLGFFSLLALDADNACVSAMVYIGIAADLEGLAISMTLSKWRSDVPSLWHARQLSRQATEPDQVGQGLHKTSA